VNSTALIAGLAADELVHLALLGRRFPVRVEIGDAMGGDAV